MERDKDLGDLHKYPRITTVSFSGVDGAGKTTQIDSLVAFLADQGLRVRIFRFWDDIARLTRIREGSGHAIFKGDKGIGSPEAPINRRDKNVRGWPMNWVRLFLYVMDAISLRKKFSDALRGDADVIIFDRYIYDELANLNLQSRATRAYARTIIRLIPRPDLSFILDADPEAARARKPEYPLEFIRINREAYLQLCGIIGGLRTISPTGIEAAKREVLSCVQDVLDRKDTHDECHRSTLAERELIKRDTAAF